MSASPILDETALALSEAQKQALRRERYANLGRKQIACFVPQDVIAYLDDIPSNNRGEAITKVVREHANSEQSIDIVIELQALQNRLMNFSFDHELPKDAFEALSEIRDTVANLRGRLEAKRESAIGDES